MNSSEDQPRLATFAELRGRKLVCPQCGRPSFVPYVWPDTKQAVCADRCGRCDHEQGCTYHLPPRELFRDHPELNRRRLSAEEYKAAQEKRRRELEHEKELLHQQRVSEMFGDGVPGTKVQPHIDYIKGEYVLRSEAAATDTPLFRYLCTMFKADDVQRIFKLYHVGRNKEGGTIYWQIDRTGKVRTGKIMHYQENGHRVKNEQLPGSGANWVHAKLRKQGMLPADWELQQCMFGEHLLAKQPQNSVIVVEAEKTALIGALAYPAHTWLAVGGKQMFKESMLLPLMSCGNILAYPDVGCFDDWNRAAESMELLNISVSDSLEQMAKDDPSKQGLDIGDFIMHEF